MANKDHKNSTSIYFLLESFRKSCVSLPSTRSPRLTQWSWSNLPAANSGETRIKVHRKKQDVCNYIPGI